MQALRPLVLARLPSSTAAWTQRRVFAASTSSPSSSVPEVVEGYTRATSIFHWLMAGGILASFTTVQIARNTEDAKAKLEWMT